MTAQNNMDHPHKITGLSKANARQLVQLVEMVAEEAGLSSRSIYGPDQDQFAVAFRRALWWVFREGYLLTYVNIAKIFKSANGGHFNHTSVITGINKVKEEGLLVFSESKGRWVSRSGASCSDVRLRQALQITAAIWNEINPQIRLKTWTRTNSQ